MRSLLFFLTLATSAILTSHAEEPRSTNSASSEGVWTITPSVTSAYLFRGVQLAGPSLQPALEFNAAKFSSGLWSNVAFNVRSRIHSNPEVDWYADYIFEVPSSGVSLMPGFTLYTYPRAKSGDFHPLTFEPSLAAIFNIHGIQVTPKIYYDLVLQSLTGELNATLALPLKHLGTELDFAATAGTFEGNNIRRRNSPVRKNSGDYWSLGVSLPVQVSLSSKVVLGFTYSEGHHNYFQATGSSRETNPDAGRHAAVSLSYTLTY
jgi:hypothetical protein